MPKVLPGEAPAPPPTETTTDRMDPSVQATLPKENPRTPTIQYNASPPGQGQRMVDVYDAGLAGRLDISQIRTNNMFAAIDPTVVKQAPYTTAYFAAVNQQEATMQAINDTLVHYGSLYGDNAMGAFVMTHLIEDPVSAQRTRDLIGDLAGMDPSTYSPQMLTGAGDTGDVNGNLETILADPTHMAEAFARLTPAEQLGVHDLAQSLQESLATKSSVDVDGFMRTVAVAKNGYQTLLGPDEQRALSELVKLAGTGIGGTTTSIEDVGKALGIQGAALGIDQIRRQGGGVLVMDEAEAKANPAQALAVKEFLEAQYPEATIQIGKQGFLPSLIEKLGMPIDYISAPIGAGLHQLTEGLQELTADGDPQQTLKLIDQAQKQIQEVGVPPKWVRDGMTAGIDFGDPENPQDVQRFLDHFRDQNTFDIGPDQVWTDLKNNTRPEQMGFGLGDTFTTSAGMLPGDDGYEATRMAIGLVANIVLDPLNYVGPVIGGVRAAQRVMDVGEESLRVSNGWIKQLTYMKMAKTPEDFVLTRTFINGTKKLSKIREGMTDDEFATAIVTNMGWDIDRARELAMARPGADMEIALLADSLGIAKKHYVDDVFHVVAKRNAVNDLIEAGATPSELEALTAQKHFYDSVLKGSDNIRPYDSMPTFRQIRRLQLATKGEPTTVERAILAAEDTVRRLPGSLIPRSSRGLKRFETAAEDVRAARVDLATARKADDAVAIKRATAAVKKAESDVAYQTHHSIQRSYGEFRNIWRPAGFNGKFTFENFSETAAFTGITAARKEIQIAEAAGDKAALKAARNALTSAETQMVSAVNTGVQNFRDISRMMGIPEKRFREILQPFISGNMTDDVLAQRDWFLDAWRTVVDESPKFSGLAKKDLRDLYKVMVHDRAGSLMTVGGHFEPTLERHIPGQFLPYATPSLSAEMTNNIPFPSLEQFRSYATNTGRTMKYWETLGGPRRAVSTIHGYLAKGWQQGNSIWRSWVLGSRLAFGLPARIIGEQQLRMAAFEHDSMVWHPLEWFRSTNWNASFFDKPDDIWDAFGSPVHALGTMVDNVSPQWAGAGRSIAAIDDGLPFFRSYADEVAKYFRSPEVAKWRFVEGEIQTPRQMIERMREAGDEGKMWMRHIEATVKPGQTVDDAVEVAASRMVEDMTQLIGKGPESEFVRKLVRNGHAVGQDGVDYVVGTERLGKYLKDLVDNHQWRPGKMHLPYEQGAALASDWEHPLQKIRDAAFGAFYSKPDLATSRVALYHQIAEQQHDNLIKLGYSEERATEVARSVAAEQTADMLFAIGAHTSGEMFLRTLMPFFPAYRELGTTWLYRLPMRMGQLQESRLALLGYGLGATVLTRRAALIMDTMQQAGFVKQDVNGKWTVPISGLGGLLNWATGANTEWNTDISLESVGGILPLPFGLFETDDEGKPLPWNERLRGTLPTLGGMSVATMASLKSKFPDIIGPAETWSTMFGSDTSFGPHALDLLWQTAFHGDTPPWVFGRTAALQEATYQFAITDGKRLAMNEIPAPQYRPDFTQEEQEQFNKELRKWADEVDARGQKYATGIYMMKAVLGSALPFSISLNDQTRDDYGHLWELLNRLPGGSTGELAGGIYGATMGRHPEYAPYAVSKSLDKRDFDDPDRSIKAYMDAIADGKMTPRGDDWTLFAWGSLSRTLHYANLSRIRRESGDTYGERMMNREASVALDKEKESWDTFMTWSELSTKELGKTQSLKDMFNTYDRYRHAKNNVPEISAAQQGLIDADRAISKYAEFFDYNYETAGKWFKARSEAYDALTAAFPYSEEAQAKSWYFKKVAGGYYEKRDDVYNQLATSKDQSQVFSQARRLSDRNNHEFTNPQHPEWGTFPSPEMYSWSLKPPQDQDRLRAKWAANPADWLTEFQRDQVNYDIPKEDQSKVSRWADYHATLDHQMRVYEEAHDISSSSNDHEANLAQRDALLAARAKKLGITDEVAKFDAPIVERVGTALSLESKTGTIVVPKWADPSRRMNSWDYLTKTTKFAMGYLNSMDIDPQGENAQPTRELFTKFVIDARKQDPALDDALNEIGLAIEKTNIYDLVDYLFFEKTFG